MKNFKSGFSLLEMIIVIVIIGVLLSAIIGLSGAKDTAKFVSAKEQILNIKKTTDAYLSTNGKTLYSTLGAASQPNIENFISNGYKFPMNPWSRNYTIIGDATGLKISTDTGTPENCNVMKTQLGTSSSSSSCAGSVFTATFNDWN